MSSSRPASTDSHRTNAAAPASTTAPTAERTAPPTLNERLENLPFTRAHGKLLGISGLGWALDAMDVGLISFVMAALIKEWHLSPTEASWLGSIGFAGMALGATFGGLLADKLGRRYIFALTLLIYGLATGASALATSLGVLLVFRFLVGLGLGAELPVASTLISEFSPRAIRGRVVVALEAFWAVGWILAALIGTFVVPQANGWRWALAIGLVPAIYSLVIRLGTPESVRFLESVGKHDDARRVVERFEASPALFPNAKKAEDSAEHGAVESADNAESAKVHSIWAAGQRRKTIALCVIWFCINLSYYGAFIWIPTLLSAQGFSLVKSFAFTLIMTLAQLPGYAVAAYLIEKWGPPRNPRRVPARLRPRSGWVRYGAHRGIHHPRRLHALLLQPRCVGRSLRSEPGNLPDPPARNRHRCRRRYWSYRLHRGAAHCAAAGRIRWNPAAPLRSSPPRSW